MAETSVDRSAVKRSLQTFAVYLKVETPWTGGEREVLPIHGTQGLGPRNSEDPLFTDWHSDGGPEEVEEVRPRIDKDTVFRRYQLLLPQAQQDQRAVVLPVIRPKTLIPHPNNRTCGRREATLICLGLPIRILISQISNQKGFIEIEQGNGEKPSGTASYSGGFGLRIPGLRV